MKSLVLAEKPSVGKDLARVLGCRQGGKGYFESAEYLVTWAMGHLVELAAPEAYDFRYKNWNMETLPMMPEKMKYRVIRKTSRQFHLVKTLMKRSDIDMLIIATDAGREGELVARLIMKLASWKGPFKRLWISSQTKEAIQTGFHHLVDGRSFDPLYQAALCRSEADWIVGLNVTRALSCKYDVRLSAGRVQTPTLALIIMREKEREEFTGRKYWTIKGDFHSFYGTWQNLSGVTRLFNKEEALTLIQDISGKEARVISLDRKEKKIFPPLAYDLTALQREANTRLGFSAKKTLSVLQRLYERHKIATYPRTDSRYITTDIVPTLSGRLRSLKNTSFGTAARRLLNTSLQPGARFVNNAKVTEHHAIIPTGDPVIPDNLDSDEKKLMNLIIQRFLEVLSPPLKKELYKAKIQIGKEIFISRGEKILEKGWSAISGERIVEEDASGREELSFQKANFPPEGSLVKVQEIILHEGITKPPPRYTEGTLLGVMENPRAFITDVSLRRSLASSGLGTPATRADIIEKILANSYIEREGKELRPTPRGMALLALVPEALKSPALTARWEQRLALIAEGKESSASFLRDIRETTVELVEKIKRSTLKYTPPVTGGKKCPLCGRPMMRRKDARGRKLLVCYTLSCGYEEFEEENGRLSMRPGRKEKAINRKLVARYSDTSKTTATFGALIMEAGKRKKKQ